MMVIEIRARLFDVNVPDDDDVYHVVEALVLTGLEAGVDYEPLIQQTLVGIEVDLRRRLSAEQAARVALKRAG